MTRYSMKIYKKYNLKLLMFFEVPQKSVKGRHQTVVVLRFENIKLPKRAM